MYFKVRIYSLCRIKYVGRYLVLSKYIRDWRAPKSDGATVNQVQRAFRRDVCRAVTRSRPGKGKFVIFNLDSLSPTPMVFFEVGIAIDAR